MRKTAHFFFSCAFKHTKNMKNIAIFASGSGTNAENIARYFANSENVNVAVVLSNNRNVGVHGR